MVGTLLVPVRGARLPVEVGRCVGPVIVRVVDAPFELGRTEVGTPGRAEGIVLGRTPWLVPRDGLGLADGRETPPLLEGRGAGLDPREPWLEEGRE